MHAVFDKLIVFLASLYVAKHLKHHCHGEHCHVCHHIHRCLELISVCLELVATPFELAYRCFYFRLVYFKRIESSSRTLVSQKILLLN